MHCRYELITQLLNITHSFVIQDGYKVSRIQLLTLSVGINPVPFERRNINYEWYQVTCEVNKARSGVISSSKILCDKVNKFKSVLMLLMKTIAVKTDLCLLEVFDAFLLHFWVARVNGNWSSVHHILVKVMSF